MGRKLTEQEIEKGLKAYRGPWQMLSLIGWDEEDMTDRPVIAVVNTFSDI